VIIQEQLDAERRDDFSKLTLSEIIDGDSLQFMMEELYKITHVLSAVLDISGNILIAFGWQDICTKFHRCHPDTMKNCVESDTILSKGLVAGEYKAYRCKNNLWDIATPIIVGDQHLGNIFLGQFFYDDEILDYDLFRRQARQYGFNEEEYLAALDRVPRLRRDTVDSMMKFYAKLAGMISSMSYSRVSLSHALARQKAVAHKLNLSEERFSKAFNLSPNMILITCASDGKIVDNNLAFQSAFGYPQEVLDEKTTLELGLWEEIDDRNSVISDLKKGIPVLNREFLFRNKSKKILPCLFSAKNILINDEAYIINSLTDISQRKRTEDDLKKSYEKFESINKQLIKSQHKLSKSESFLNSVIDQSPVSTWISDSSGIMIRVNKACLDMLNTTSDEVLGKYNVLNDNILKEQGLIPLVKNVYEKGSIARFELVYDSSKLQQINLNNSTNLILDVTIFPIKDETGKVTNAVIQQMNVTERKQAEEEQEKLQVQLTQAQRMESVGRLAGGVAHDFNNMLGVILGNADMILEDLDPSQQSYADVEEIRKAAQRSADLTRQLLAFARKQTIKPKVLDLNQTLEGMLQMLRRIIGEDIDLIWQPGKNLWKVKIDPSQIDQMLANLCVNARDSIADVGEIAIKTLTAVFDESYCLDHGDVLPGEFLLLSVSDNGCGMDEETLAQIFEPFFTTKELGKGTGLGLSTIYGIVKQNKGFVNVCSEPGQGTTFNIYLPRHFGKTTENRTKDPAKVDEGGNETILLVEDEPSILSMTTTMLERLGYTVVAAANPGEAIRLAREHAGSIDLLMTDVVMPEMNGRDLAKSIRLSYPDIKRLFMSGYTADVIAHHGVLDEGVHFIQKPFSKNDLSLKIGEIMNMVDCP
jgi:PAS domain S-box-containing protein